jgi:hypothetical protein
MIFSTCDSSSILVLFDCVLRLCSILALGYPPYTVVVTL